MTTIEAIEQKKEDTIRSVDRLIDQLIKAGLKQVDWAYDVILSLAKCRISVVFEIEKEEESEQLE